jgi:transcriptional regulator with XRE-family HTH domain
MVQQKEEYLVDNLKHLRKLFEMTQQDAADQFEVKKSAYASYEEGRAVPPYSNIRKIATFYKLTIDILITKDLTKSNVKNYLNIGNERLLFPVSVDAEGNEMIDVVPIKASAGYLSGYSDPSYIMNLPKIQFPFKNIQGTGRLFQIHGDSMLPITSESYVISELEENIQTIKEGECYILITLNEGIVYKRIFKSEKKNNIKLVSDNTNYAPYDVPLSEIREIWKAKGFMSFELPIPASENDVKNSVAQLQKDMDILKEKLRIQ